VPVAFVTGILGQDGHYLADLLETRGFVVHGLVVPGMAAPDADGRTYHQLDLTDSRQLIDLLGSVSPDHVYHLAGISSVARSWDDAVETMTVNATGSVAMLEGAWRSRAASGKNVRYVQAASAEMFGQAEASPQSEATPIRPVNPYGASKAAAHLAVGVYRARGLHASSLILYNHESPLRGKDFVTRKITSTVAAIARGEATELRLGNLDARRDWGWAPDYVRAMVLAAEHDAAGDYVIGTGAARSVRDFVAAAFKHVGIADWERFVVVDPAFFRPVDPAELRGDASKARRILGWAPSVTFEQMVAAMVDEDLS
jgi:GDPmannose 4,6-dehydratase